VTIDELLVEARKIWPTPMDLSEIIVALGVIYGDICRLERDFGPIPPGSEVWKELEKELGNIVFSTIRWMDDLDLRPGDCIASAQFAQRRFRGRIPFPEKEKE